MCVGESWPFVASVRVTSESVEEWIATGTRDEEGDRLADAGVGGATLVRQENLRAAGEWYGELGGTGRRGTKTPRGKLGALRRIYQPRKGRCISHNTFDVALSYKRPLSHANVVTTRLRTTTCSTISLSDNTRSCRCQVAWKSGVDR